MALGSQSLRAWVVLLAGILLCSGAAAAEQAAEKFDKKASGLPVPRFVSLKSDKVNVRGGPTKDHEVTWMYTRAGLPVEVTAEFETWRRIRDWEGSEGWVYHSLLSGRRTAVVTPKANAKDDLIPLHESANAQSAVAAKLQPGVLGTIKRCSNGWCRLAGEGYDGWVQ